MEYNTSRNYLNIREYGRHIQKMVEHVLTLEDRQKRNQQTKLIIELMGLLNPHLKNVEDFRHILWDHLFFISDFKLDVDSPYPIPQKDSYKTKPDPLPYPKRYPKFLHLGKNLELIIDKGIAENNEDNKAKFVNAIAYYMKVSYNTWHKENMHDDAIKSELLAISNGKLELKYNNQKPRNPNLEKDNTRNGNTRRPLSYQDSRSNNKNMKSPNMKDSDRRNNSGSLNKDATKNNRNFKKRF